MEKVKPELEALSAEEPSQEGLPEEPPARPAWSNKAEYILAQVGFSVGLGNIWRFPYLCHQNGGGAFLLLYFLLLLVVGIPLFFLELAAGQSVRQGSIGVWQHLSPRLVGIGFASCVVCGFVSLYYNVIIAWSIFYLVNSFYSPLPWTSCPQGSNHSQPEPECAMSSSTTYFWYRKALDVSESINTSGGLNLPLAGCLLAAWALVCAALIKGIKSSGKVLYFSSLFPYVVLFCFLVRGLLLDGAAEGIRIMFTPKLTMWGDIHVWRQAATQVFFALGLGFGSVIAYSSYNGRRNNCHADALLVAFINFLTSLLATTVVFAVLGFRASSIAKICVKRNAEKLAGLQMNSSLPGLLLPEDLEVLSPRQYSAWFHGLSDATATELQRNGVGDCQLEEEMNKGVEGTGLAFITFTEAMTLFPASPFWSVLFFLMLLNLGLSTMLGNMQGILTPLLDRYPALRRRAALFTVLCCAGGFLLGLMFVQRSGSYFVSMFDDYSATLPLIVVVVFEDVAVAWVYGANRFLGDVEAMLGWRPWRLYGYMWRFGSLLAMLGLLLASLVQICRSAPIYQAWSQKLATETWLSYPRWAQAMLILLIVVATLPIPVLYLWQWVRERQARRHRQGAPPVRELGEGEEESPADPQCLVNGYLPVRTE
ncbi:orphan sodium- and chloride-dependent neurotransmitter transporter NTT5 [Pelodiscus sinensis]|uniref:orphan sodium- and chloride-dependent neurotransmitter transporter NTT5 n=1 Tax=Pelodiscus sinensis TaxID=13735 RepID=UPI003F6C9119